MTRVTDADLRTDMIYMVSKSIVLAWMPRVDGVFLTADPQYLVQQGSVADVPFINGTSEVVLSLSCLV